MNDKISWIIVECSKCKKNTKIPSRRNLKTPLCRDCYHDKNLKFKVKWDKIKNFSEIPDTWFFDSSIADILNEIDNTRNKEIEASLKQLIVIKLAPFLPIKKLKNPAKIAPNNGNIKINNKFSTIMFFIIYILTIFITPISLISYNLNCKHRLSYLIHSIQ